MNIGKVSENLKRLSESSSYLIAYSGGIDSHVLLHVLSRLRPDIHLRAMHVHHGLHPQADQWLLHCERVCHDLKITFLSRKIAVFDNGESVEAQARECRYRVLAKHLESEECLLTAHTQDDQAETLLLQLLRGAGVKGLSAMPFKKAFAHSLHLRPLLMQSREEIKKYANEHHLQWIEDDSNQNTRFDRNYLRQNIFPLLKKRWPAVMSNLARSAGHCAEATLLLETMAEEDLYALQGSQNNTLSISALLECDEGRRKNVLRYWFLQMGIRLPNSQHYDQIIRDVLQCANDATPIFKLETGELRRYRDDLYFVPFQENYFFSEMIWDCQSPLKLPGNYGELHPKDFSNYKTLTIRCRRGGETIQFVGNSTKHSLKKLFQQWGVPPWERDRIPLVFDGERLIGVVGYYDFFIRDMLM